MKGQRGRANFLNTFKVDSSWKTYLQIHHPGRTVAEQSTDFLLYFYAIHVLLIKTVRRWGRSNYQRSLSVLARLLIMKYKISNHRLLQ